jgi:hypothetical protein
VDEGEEGMKSDEVHMGAPGAANVHQDVRAAFEKHGIVDFFYGGVQLDGADRWGARYGMDGTSNSNRERKQRLTGVLVEVILDLNAETIRSSLQARDQPGE